MKIINPNFEDGDFHLHSITYSDGMNSIDEIVQFAGKIGLKKIAITDHSQATLSHYGFHPKTFRSLTRRWRNVHNGVEVIFGVEGDLLNQEGVVSAQIQNRESDFLILSVHESVYVGAPETINKAYIRALEKYHDKIKMLGHPCVRDFEEHLNIEMLVKLANQYQIPVELNCANLVNQKTNLDNLGKMLKICDTLYINSDAHTLWEMQEMRKVGIKYLQNKKYL